MADDTKTAADRLLAAAEKDGIAVHVVKDGHVLVFTKQHLLGILAKMEESGQGKAIVYVKDRSTIN
jgi:hypothetical protein